MSMSVSMRRRDNYLILMLMFKLVLLLTLTPSSFLPDAKSVGSGIGALLVVAALTCLSGVFARRSLAPPVLPGTSARGMAHCRPSKSTGTCLSTLSLSVTSLLKLLHFQLHTLPVPLLFAAAAFALPDLKRCCARLASFLNPLTFRTPTASPHSSATSPAKPFQPPSLRSSASAFHLPETRGDYAPGSVCVFTLAQ